MITLSTRRNMRKLREIQAGIEEAFIGRASVVRQIIFALLTKEHVLIEGPPGVAKSYLAKTVFERFTGAEVFRIQCTQKMTEDSLVGPPNVRILREKGQFIHNVEGTLVTADFGFVDEFLDLSKGALRALLEVLNERSFSRGTQFVRSPLHTCIATTNFNKDNDDELKAVLDRFMFRAKIPARLTKGERKRMLGLRSDMHLPTMSYDTIRSLHEAVNEVNVPQAVLDPYLEMCERLSLTDRKVRRCMKVLKASALYHGRNHVNAVDLLALDTCFAIANDPASENLFGGTVAVVTPAIEAARAVGIGQLLMCRLSVLASYIYDAQDYDSCKDAAIEIATIRAAIPTAHPDLKDMYAKCDALLNKADDICLATTDRSTP